MKQPSNSSIFCRVIATLCITQFSWLSPQQAPPIGTVATPVIPTAPQQPLQAPVTPAPPAAIPPQPPVQLQDLPATPQAAQPTLPIIPQPAPAPTVTTPAPVVPTQPAQQPTALPALTPTTVATTPTPPSPAQPTQQPTVVSVSTPAAPAAPAIPQQDLDQISTTITAIKTLKSSVQDQLKDIDEKIYEARMLDAQAKKLSFTILDAASDAEASKILSQVQEASKKIQLLEEMIKGSMAKNIADSMTKIQDQMKTLDDLVKKLEAQGISFQAKELAALDVSSAKAVDKTQQATTSKTPAPASGPVPVPVPVEKTIETKSFFGHLSDSFITMTVGVIKAVGNLCAFVKHSIMPATITTTTQQAPKTPAQELTHQELTHKEVAQPVMPASTQPVTGEVKKKASEPVTEQAIKEELHDQLKKTDLALKNIDQTEENLSTKYHEIEKPLNKLVDTVSGNAAVQEQLTKKAIDAPLIESDSTFKKTTVGIFSSLTDLFISGVNFITREIKKAYRYIKSRILAEEAQETHAKKTQDTAHDSTKNTVPDTPNTINTISSTIKDAQHDEKPATQAPTMPLTPTV